jgi:hypothetical protein
MRRSCGRKRTQAGDDQAGSFSRFDWQLRHWKCVPTERNADGRWSQLSYAAETLRYNLA